MSSPTTSRLPDSYTAGLRDVLADGNDVDSVRDPLSKASGFGQNDRPYRELLAYQSRLADPTSCLAVTPHLPVNLSYCFGLLAWSLDGRNDVDTPAYYRRGAHEYSDDQHTLSGAFGHRLLTSRGNQLEEVVGRIERDPAHRRAFALVLQPEDNFRQSREYPCAVGVHLFLRDGALTWITVMPSPAGADGPALRRLPLHGDAAVRGFAAERPERPVHTPVGHLPLLRERGGAGPEDHRSARGGRGAAVARAPRTAAGRPRATHRLRAAATRLAAQSGDVSTVDKIATHKANTEFADVARACLATHAYRKLGDTTSLVTSPASNGGVANLIAAI